ncbi:hypothetical protein V8G54_023791 [Vigna mungo]|uniref:Uncharacterized protein n=1 Tax=Vigna mungo TaxID=3915 RepID=A0AAQ3N3S8_VIGMU
MPRTISPFGSSHILFRSTVSHSERDDLLYNKLPIVFKARGSPVHFLTIFLPISLHFGFGSVPSRNACLANNSQLSSSCNCFRKHSSDSMVETTCLLRVVTTILLPWAPKRRGFCTSSQLDRVSFQTSSKTTKNFLPVNFSFNLL